MAKILIVDDHPINRELLITLLQPFGHQVVEACDGVEALKLAETEQPSLVISDIHMPKMNGRELIARLRAQLPIPAIPVILHTASSSEAEVLDAANGVGAFAVLVKPTDPQKLLEVVNHALALHTPVSLHEMLRTPGGANSLVLERPQRKDRVFQEDRRPARDKSKFAALVELILGLASAREPERLLELLCPGARRLVGASYAIAGLLAEDGETTSHLFRSGFSGDEALMAARLRPPAPNSGRLGEVLRSGRPQCLRNVDVKELAMPDPFGRILVPSLLMVPVATPERSYGWLCLTDKIGESEFTMEDERLSATLAAQAAVTLESHRRYALVKVYTSELEREIEERKLAEGELERSRQDQLRLRDEFLSHVSHELRSPLASIHQFTTILLDGLVGELNGEQRECLETVLRGTRHLSAMVEDLLTITRAGAGKLVIVRKYTCVSDPSGGVLETLHSLEKSAADKRIELRSHIAAGLPPVWVDPERTCQILTNLIQNAVKFTPEGGHITVDFRRFDKAANFVLVSVSDTGCGISREHCERIFERLFQVANNDEARRGLGLGLHIAKDLTTRQGGQIWVESELGRGSTFFFTLPVFELAPLLAAVLTESTLEKRSPWLLTIAFPSPPGGALQWQHSRRLRNNLLRWVRPETDMILPAMGVEKAPTIHLLVCTDPTGIQKFANRIGQNLHVSGKLLEMGGPLPTVSFIALEGSGAGSGRPVGERVQEVAGEIERLIGIQMASEENA